MSVVAIPLGPTEVSRHAALSRRLGLFSFPLLGMATIFHRLGIADTADVLPALGLAFLLGAIALVLGAWALARIWVHGYAGAPSAGVGTSWGLATIAPVLLLAPIGFTTPRINQVSTDLADPPAFVWVDRARGVRPGPVPAISPEVRALQADAYPRVTTLRVDMPALEAYQLAVQLVERRRWQILDRRAPAVPTTRPAGRSVAGGVPGRIEATARTPLFGFPDDVVIRITPAPNDQARVDMRSASRFGQHDFGANARRITEFLTEMRDRALER